MNTRFFGVAASVLALVAGLASGQCTTGLQPIGYFGVSDENGSLSNVGPSARVNAMTAWDPDGSGPLPEQLVVGGAFRSIDGVPAEGIARWDGSGWQAIGAGFPSRGTPQSLNDQQDSEVTALAVHNGQLYAAGRISITTPTGATIPVRVARWSGAAWEFVGTELTGGSSPTRVNAMASAHGRLYIGGSFMLNTAQGVRYSLASLSDTNTWVAPSQTVSSGLLVRSMVATQGRLFIAGQLPVGVGQDSRIAEVVFTGEIVNTGLQCSFSCSGSVQQLVTDGTTLYAIGDQANNNALRGVVRRAIAGGAWELVGPTLLTSAISSVAVDANGLLRTTGTSLERWNGTAWVPQGGSSVANGSGAARLLGTFEGRAVVGGRFGTVQDGLTSINGPRFLESLAWAGENGRFIPITTGIDDAISDMALLGTDIIAVGRFGSAGGQRADYVAVYGADNRWRPWQNNAGFARPTRSVVIYQGQPVVSGGYGPIGQLSSPFVRRWDGAQWVALGTLPGVADPLIATGDELWAEARQFRGSQASTLHRWNGAAWEAIVSDGSIISGLQGIQGQIWATRLSGLSLSVVRWNGGTWETPGPLTQPSRSLLGEFQGRVLAFGNRSEIYEFDGSDWQYVGVSPLPSSSFASAVPAIVRRVASSADALYIAAVSSQTGGSNLPTLLRFDGRSWSTLGALPLNLPQQPISYVTTSLGLQPVVRGNELFVGGPWIGRPERTESTANFWRRGTAYFGKIVDPWASTFAALENTTIGAGDTLTINAGASRGTRGSWTRNGVVLGNGELPSGAVVSGAGTDVLQIANITTDLAGVYQYTTFFDGCGVASVITSWQQVGAASAGPGVLVTVRAPCDGIDFNNDGALFDPLDIEAFLSVFSEGPCLPEGATCNDVDFNNDGVQFDPEDVDAFLRVFAEGGC